MRLLCITRGLRGCVQKWTLISYYFECGQGATKTLKGRDPLPSCPLALATHYSLEPKDYGVTERASLPRTGKRMRRITESVDARITAPPQTELGSFFENIELCLLPAPPRAPPTSMLEDQGIPVLGGAINWGIRAYTPSSTLNLGGGGVGELQEDIQTRAQESWLATWCSN